ncbi:MAG: hypothetical protein FP826_06880 [Sphingomonadales bacterium]|nr:hypothetical protein [Sphingomonadales bacterium]MBU3993620.1 hypothetical protein [Alphaproteobacteria bacterium]
MAIWTAIFDVLDRIGMGWFNAKTFVEHTIAFSHDALHVIVGVCLQLLLASLLQVSVRSPWPWSIVLTLEIANEAADLHGEVWPDHAMQWGESAKDVLLTMCLPTLLLLLARFRPQLFSAAASAPVVNAEE